MDKEKLKKGLYISGIIFIGLALAITYFFLIYSNVSIGDAIGKVMLILRPFIVGAVIAYILKSTCNGYEKLLRKISKKKQNVGTNGKAVNIIAVILTYITWVAIVGALLWIAIPQIVESISTFIQDAIDNMPMYIETINKWIIDFETQYPDLTPVLDQAGDYVTNWLTTTLPEMLPDIGSTAVNTLLGIVNFLKDFAIGLVISVFFLAGRKTFAKKTALLVNTFFKEKHANAIIGEAKYADRMFSGFLEGKIIDSTIIGIIYFIALLIMDIKYAALLALICGITNIIPFFGPFIGAVPSGLIILMSNEDPLKKLIFFIIFVCVIQFVDGNIIDPHIVGGNIKMSPFCVIFAVLLFGGLWGFTGLLIGVPTFAVIYDICKKIVYHRLKKTGKGHILKAHLNEFGNKKRKEPVSANESPIQEDRSDESSGEIKKETETEKEQHAENETKEQFDEKDDQTTEKRSKKSRKRK